MSKLRHNVVANMVGQGANAAMALACIPLYVHFMGVEAYGLVGVYLALQGLAAPLDLGLSTTLNRQFAVMAGDPGRAREMRDLLRTLETVYCVISVAICCGVAALAPVIAHVWLKPDSLAPSEIQESIRVMGLVLGFFWPVYFYSGGMQGLQRQVPLNVILVVMDVVRFGGAVLVLWLVSPTLKVFFLWQALSNAIHAVILRYWLGRELPSAGEGRPRFDLSILGRVWKFAAGISGISVLALVLTHMDKVLLSRFLSLRMFGYYSLAAIAASGLTKLTGPVFAALFPRFSQIVASGDRPALTALYHAGCQFMAVLLLPAAVLAAMFSSELLYMWTGDYGIAANADLIFAFLVLGTAMNGLMNLPYAMQLAHGWTSLAFVTDLVSMVLLVPLLFVVTGLYGAAGAASVWMFLNAGYLLITVPIMHRFILKGELGKWYVADIGRPLLAVAVVAVPARFLISPDMPAVLMIPSLAVAGVVALIAAGAAVPAAREWVRRLRRA